ncbi:uncharacterized protein Dwil_GK21873 [Drosophila willistoni]|uniref:GK21873 n=1 Tax=Drosophila willistoni TaxID=7260 RepID=B4MQH2_DROWI|nr:uncharacterized protein LOC6640461 [Drosophila willistoni]EDW74361.1 uncharacterized protein Dwil_GK21873 [Drosophila willistoni]
MIPQNNHEFVIVRLSFVPYIHPHYPRISYQLRKYPPSGSIVPVRDWFEHVMMRERSNLPSESHIRFCEWRILTGQLELFNINGYRYDKIMLILGEDSVSWVYYQCLPIHPRIEGSAKIPISYCSCCLENQYLTIMDKIKEIVLGYANE